MAGWSSWAKSLRWPRLPTLGIGRRLMGGMRRLAGGLLVLQPPRRGEGRDDTAVDDVAREPNRREREQRGPDPHRTDRRGASGVETDSRDSNRRARVDGPETSGRSTRAPRFFLELDEDLEAAPSIGPKTAKRFAKIGVHSVADFVALRPKEAASQIGARHITADKIRDWQDQAKLVCRVPELRGHDAQILVACGYRHPNQIAQAEPETVLAKIEPYAETSDGQWVIRSGKLPDREEISGWIENANQCRKLRAAA